MYFLKCGTFPGQPHKVTPSSITLFYILHITYHYIKLLYFSVCCHIKIQALPWPELCLLCHSQSLVLQIDYDSVGTYQAIWNM